MTAFRGWLESLGLKPRDVSDDGRWRRCPTNDHPKSRNGAYKLLPGGTMGFAQDWASMESPLTWRAGEGEAADEFDKHAWGRMMRQRQEEETRAIQAARRYYHGSNPLRGSHPYLDRQGLTVHGCNTVRLGERGELVVPCYRDGVVVSVQRIAEDGGKLFWKGAPVAGSSYTIERKGAPLTVLCEGWATGVAIYQAVPFARVLVAWNTGNLETVGKGIRGMAVVAADNDHGTEAKRGTNPGILAAKDAADAMGCGYAYPSDIKGTDWADYRRERVEHLRENGYRGNPFRQVDQMIAARLQVAARIVFG